MKRLIIISFILISTNAFAFGKCEDRLQEIEEDLSRVRHHLGLYKTTQYLGLYKTTQLFETDRLKILEDKVVYLEKYLREKLSRFQRRLVMSGRKKRKRKVSIRLKVKNDTGR